MDNLLPKPTWEESVKTKPTYLANFDWSKAFSNPLNRSETINILAMKGPGGTKDVAQLWVIGKIEYATLVINQFPSYIVKLCLTNNNQQLVLHIEKMGEPWQRFGSGKPWVGAKLCNKARQGRGTYPAYRRWWKSSRSGRNHPLSRQISLHIWRLEIGRCRYRLIRPRTRRQWLQVRWKGGYRFLDLVAELQSFQKCRRRKGVFISTVGSIPCWWPNAFNNVNTRQASTWRQQINGYTRTHQKDSYKHESARILVYI